MARDPPLHETSQGREVRIAHTESSVNLGGKELRVLEHVRWLNEHGHHSWLLAPPGTVVWREAECRGIPLVPVRFRGSFNPSAVAALARFVRRHRVDLIDCHSTWDAATAMVMRLFGCRIVRSQHIGKHLRNDVFHRLLWRYGCDRIIAVSEGIASHIVAQGLAGREKIDVVWSCIDLSRFRPDIDGTPVRDMFGIPHGAKLIVQVGMIRPDKGQHHLVHAVDRIVAEVPEAWFLLVGSPTRPEYLEGLKAEIAQVRHGGRIVLAGFRRDVENCLAAADVVVIASEMEGRTQVVPQAFAMRKPVVASAAGGTPEMVEDGQTGFLFPVGDTDRLARAVVRAVSAPAETDRVVEKAYAMALERFGTDVMMQMTLETYRTVLRRSR